MRERKTTTYGRRGILLLQVGAMALAAGAAPDRAQADDWISSVLDSRCDPADVTGVTDSVRNAIEASVRRAEAAIQAPTPVGDLSCLNDLMTAPLDTFSNIGGLLGSFQLGLKSLPSLSFDIDVSGMICELAAVKWSELTKPLSTLNASISQYASAPSDMVSRLASGSIGSGGSSGLFPGVSGVLNLTDSSGYAGNIASYVPPDTSVSSATAALPIFTSDPPFDDSAYDPAEVAAYEAALQHYDDMLQVNLAAYLACQTSRTLNNSRIDRSYGGDDYWRSAVTSCGNPFTGLPTRPAFPSPYSSAAEAAEPEVVPSAREPKERSFGQKRPEPVANPGPASIVAPDADASPSAPASPASIWEMIGRPATVTP